MVSKVRAPLAIMRNAKRSIKAFVLFQIMRPVKVVKMAPGRVHPPGDPDVALSVLMQSYTRTHKKKVEGSSQAAAVSVLQTPPAQGRMLKRVVTERRLADR